MNLGLEDRRVAGKYNENRDQTPAKIPPVVTNALQIKRLGGICGEKNNEKRHRTSTKKTPPSGNENNENGRAAKTGKCSPTCRRSMTY
jgi:hypothetical protein